MSDAILLSGAVAKGAFGAGALRVLVRAPGLDVRRIVAASSGALNAAYLAGALAAGTERTSLDGLANLWLDHGTFGDAFDVSPRGIVSLEGLSSNAKLLAPPAVREARRAAARD